MYQVFYGKKTLKITVDDVRVKSQSHQLQVLFVAVSRSIMHSTVSFGVAQRWISTIIQQMLHTPESIETQGTQTQNNFLQLH